MQAFFENFSNFLYFFVWAVLFALFLPSFTLILPRRAFSVPVVMREFLTFRHQFSAGGRRGCDLCCAMPDSVKFDLFWWRGVWSRRAGKEILRLRSGQIFGLTSNLQNLFDGKRSFNYSCDMAQDRSFGTSATLSAGCAQDFRFAPVLAIYGLWARSVCQFRWLAQLKLEGLAFARHNKGAFWGRYDDWNQRWNRN